MSDVVVEFYLDAAPISLNMAYPQGKRGRYKSIALKEWESSVDLQLSSLGIKKKLQELRQGYNPKKHHFRSLLNFYYPVKKLITKRRTISKTSADCTNIEKIPVDIIFKKIRLDDSQQCEVVSRRLIHDGDDFRIRIRIVREDFIDFFERHNPGIKKLLYS